MRLFDDNDALRADPRAATTHPATLDLLGEAGLADDMARVGLVCADLPVLGPAERQIDRANSITRCSRTTRGYPFVVQCEQFKTAQLILDRLRTLRNVEVLFGHEVIDVDADRRSRDGVTCARRTASPSTPAPT